MHSSTMHVYVHDRCSNVLFNMHALFATDIDEEVDEHTDIVYTSAGDDTDSTRIVKTFKLIKKGTVGRMSKAIKRKLHRRK